MILICEQDIDLIDWVCINRPTHEVPRSNVLPNEIYRNVLLTVVAWVLNLRNRLQGSGHYNFSVHSLNRRPVTPKVVATSPKENRG